MKKIFFWKNIKKEGIPFWQPWGLVGCFGRFIGFLLLLMLLIFLLSLFKECENEPGRDSDPGPVAAATDPDWNQPIEGAEDVGLPSPEENHIPPFDETDPIPNPENGGATEVYPNLLYVIFDSEADDQVFKTFAEGFTAKYPAPEHKIEYYNTGSKTSVLSVPEEKRIEICKSLPTDIPEVKFLVVPVEVMLAGDAMPNDPVLADAQKAWFYKPIQIPEAWEITKGSSDIIVGIVDSYMDLNHPELKGDRCIFPYSVTEGNSNVLPKRGVPEDAYGHGTLVTSVAVGNANNGAGASGIAPKCKFIPVSMGAALNTITEVEGILYCMYHGASVINVSCGSMFTKEILALPVEKQIELAKTQGKAQEEMWNYVFSLAEKRNVTIVWAAGNENCFSAMDTSKRNANTIRVSAIDRNLKKANFSNFGNFPEAGVHESTISAPGVDIFGALPDNKYDAWPGTSFSAPIITGIVALLKSENKDLTTAQIIKILQDTGKPIADNPEIGNIVQAKAALLKARATVAAARTES